MAAVLLIIFFLTLSCLRDSASVIMGEKVMTDVNNFPLGWDEERVNKVLLYYEAQAEHQALAEVNAAAENANYSIVLIPNELVPEVRLLLNNHARENRN